MSRPGRWLTAWPPRPAGAAVLLCVPPAGGGCGRYAQWQPLMPPGIGVLGVALPGRERRWSEPPASTLADVVDAVTRELGELTPPELPVVVFGESFGGLIGYEIARQLSGTPGRRPAALAVAACRPPSMWVGAGRGLADDEDELMSLLNLGDLGHEVDAETLAEMLDVLRQDTRLSLTYAGSSHETLACPVHAWGGADDPVVTSEHLDGWQAYAGHSFSRRQFPGGHHFCSQPDQAVGRSLAELMASVPASHSEPLEESLTWW
ncbi:alpha/beta fold hydrolase [Actinoplanes sp. NPDC051346]|uniref:thioesterase II family protein n=1 Tax=Actinoplanes sp. NPDC051346 TaxID=3155048 RepID=UPI003427BF07